MTEGRRGRSRSAHADRGTRDHPGPEGRSFRNAVLDCLRRAEGPVSLVEVACRVVAARRDCSPAAAPRDSVQRVYLALVRDQVPALERRGVVEYSDEDGTVRLAGPGTP